MDNKDYNRDKLLDEILRETASQKMPAETPREEPPQAVPERQPKPEQKASVSHAFSASEQPQVLDPEQSAAPSLAYDPAVVISFGIRKPTQPKAYNSNPNMIIK